MLIVAFLIGILIVAQGVVGLAAPDLFVALVRIFQEAPVIYVAAAVRFVFGAVLFVAAPASRAPVALRTFGALVALGGLLTPMVGVPFARLVLGWWSEGGATVVRYWATAALCLGAFVVYATAPPRRAT